MTTLQFRRFENFKAHLLIETFHWKVEFDAKVNSSFKGIYNTLFYDLAW